MTIDASQNEHNFIGCLLRSPGDIPLVSAVTPEMITTPHLREIYAAMLTLSQADSPVNVKTLSAKVRTDLFRDIGPPRAEIALLHKQGEDSGSATDWAPFLQQQCAQRKIREMAAWVAKESQGTRPPEEVLAEAQLQLRQIMEMASPVRRERLADTAARALRHTSEDGKPVARATGIPTGIGPIDQIVGRIFGLTFLLASQGEGKSAMAAQIAMNAAMRGEPVLYFQFEMDGEEMGARELAALSGVSVATITDPQADFLAQRDLEAALAKLKGLPFWLIDVDEMTVDQIAAEATAMYRTTGLTLVVIDQLDKIKAVGKHGDRFERFAEITRALKKLSKSLPDVTFLVLGQRTRGAQRRDDPTPDVIDADAPTIERDADILLATWMPANWVRRNKPTKKGATSPEMATWEDQVRRFDGKAEAITLKHRRRKAYQQVEMRFDGARMRFVPLVEPSAVDDEIPL